LAGFRHVPLAALQNSKSERSALKERYVADGIIAAFAALQHFGSYWGKADMPKEFWRT
jgi:hypothetical protein